MRIHKTRGAAFDLDRERQWNWFRPGAGDRRRGEVHHLSEQELREFADREGLALSEAATFRAERHR